MQIFDENIKLVYLDTNALSNFISNTKNFRTNLKEFLKDDTFEICFNINNVMELKKGYPERYNLFLDFFSNNPCLLFRLYPDIIKEEVRYANTNMFDLSNIAFSILPDSVKEYNLEYILEKTVPNIDDSIVDETNLIQYMNCLKNNNFEYTKFDRKYEIQMIQDTLAHWNLKLINEIDLNFFPATRIINKSFYDRIVNGKKEDIKRSDMHDIMISSVTPYIDMIVTESYQLNIIEESRRFIPQIHKLEYYKVSKFYS